MSTISTPQGDETALSATCPTCKGEGSIPDADSFSGQPSCPRCHGSGVITAADAVRVLMAALFVVEHLGAADWLTVITSHLGDAVRLLESNGEYPSAGGA